MSTEGTTTLLDELDQGAAALSYVANLQRASGHVTGMGGAEEWDARDARLRARAELAARIQRQHESDPSDICDTCVLLGLTGPLPPTPGRAL